MGITDIQEQYLASDFDKDEPDVILFSDRDIEINTDTGEVKDGDFDDDLPESDSALYFGTEYFRK